MRFPCHLFVQNRKIFAIGARNFHEKLTKIYEIWSRSHVLLFSYPPPTPHLLYPPGGLAVPMSCIDPEGYGTGHLPGHLPSPWSLGINQHHPLPEAQMHWHHAPVVLRLGLRSVRNDQKSHFLCENVSKTQIFQKFRILIGFYSNAQDFAARFLNFF